jgi:hypothetical protein
MSNRTLILLIAWSLLAGCTQHKQPQGAVDENRLNPPNLLTLSQLVATINANNDRIPTLWATLNYNATINDHGQVHSVTSDDGILLYQRPNNFRLVGKQALVGTVFDIGTNDRQYWLEAVPGTNRLWWGSYADLVRLNPEQLPIPIRPDLVMEVLGVNSINPDFNALPAPTLRYDNGRDAYVLVFNAKAPDRWIALKEVWYDRTTLRPKRVILYDANGRPVLKAELSHDTRVQMPDEPTANWPVVPGDYKLFFPDSGSRMEFTLRDVRPNVKRGRVTIPNAASFQVPDVSGTDIRSIQIGGGGGGA